MPYANFREVVMSAHRRVGHGCPYLGSRRSKCSSRTPSPTTAWKPSSGSFVKRDQHANVVQPEEVSVLRDNLTRQLNGGLLRAPNSEQYAQKLGAGEGLGTFREQPLARP